MPTRSILSAIVVAVSIAMINWLHTKPSTAQTVDATKATGWSTSKLWVVRLHPGDDLINCVDSFVRSHAIEAGVIVTCVGSLSSAKLRFANKPEYTNLKGPFEIVSLVGTVSSTSHHLHLALADADGHLVGGHAGAENLVFTTAEIVICEAPNWTFRRDVDPATGFRELSPINRSEDVQRDE